MKREPSHRAGEAVDGSWLSRRRRLIGLMGTMAAVVVAVAGTSIWLIYEAAFDWERVRLIELVRNQARVIEAINAHHREMPPEQALTATLEPVMDALERHEMVGDTGEFVLARRAGDRIEFLLVHRHRGLDKHAPIPFESHIAEPLRRALGGGSGAVVGLDYRGALVLAAYEPVSVQGQDLGIVAKIDLAEFRAPFVEAGGLAVVIILGLVAAGSLLFRRVGRPLLEQEAAQRKFHGLLLESAPDAMVIVNETGTIVLVNRQAEALFGYERSELLGKDLSLLVPTEHAAHHPQLCKDFFENAGVRPIGRGNELFGRVKDGREVPVEISLSPIDTAKGRFVAAAIRNISERKQARENLSRSKQELEERVGELEDLRDRMETQATQAIGMAEELDAAKTQLRDAVESISEGFALWGSDDTLIMCNEMYRRLYSGLWDFIVPGIGFEDFIREAYARGVFAEPEGGLEAAVQERIVRHRSSVSASEHRLRDGRWVRVSKRRTGTGHVVGITSDISERKSSEAQIQKMALEDPLTGLPNRTQFQAKLREATAQAKRTGRVVGLMLLDLDRFKDVNDTLGHPAGDELLKQVSGRLLDCARATDTVARLGGDEFAVIATNCTDAEGVTLLAERIVEDLAKPFLIEDGPIHTGTSIGITIFPRDSGNGDQLLRNADLALYRAKEEGRGTWRLYDEQMNADVQTQRQLEEDLRRALDREELEVAYQPRYNIATGEIVGAEALLRWSHAERGMVPPDQFIPVAESTGMIVPITQWLLREVCARNRQWQDSGLPALCLSINLSPLHFKHREVVEQVAEALSEVGLEPERLELEITEGMAMAGGESSLHLVQDLKKLGVKLSIDDFGTGYSSLDRLKKFPVDCLKIDRSFVRDITTDVNDAAICSAAIRLGHSLNIRVLAEGVETEEQLAFLIEQGCEEAQGFLFSRPLGAEDILAFLREGGQPADPDIFARAAEAPPASPANLLAGESR